jgi:hypothetical protein
MVLFKLEMIQANNSFLLVMLVTLYAQPSFLLKFRLNVFTFSLRYFKFY